MPWPWVQLPQKMRHSIGLERVTDKLIPSIDLKKSLSRSSTHAWGLRAWLSLAVKIQTMRLYFSRQHVPSATEAVACVLTGDPIMGLTTVVSWLVPPTSLPACSQERWRGAHPIGFLLRCAGSIWHIRCSGFKSSTTNRVECSGCGASPVVALQHNVEQ